jgi:hypothetical protein
VVGQLLHAFNREFGEAQLARSGADRALMYVYEREL